MLAPGPLLPATSGSQLRMANLARQLAAAVDLDVVTLGSSPQPATLPYRLTELPHPGGRLRAAASSLHRPYLAGRLSSAAMAELAGRREWQTVQVELPYLVAASRPAAAPVILDAQNVEHAVLTSMAIQESQRLRRARWQWEATKTRRLEHHVSTIVRAVCVPSEEDAEAFKRLGARRVVVVPNGVDLDTHRLRPASMVTDTPTIVYLGDFGYRPNVLAAIELVDEILPRVRRTHPGARLQLVGKEPSADLLRRKQPDVEVTGLVEDTVPYLQHASVLVVPLRAGGGTRLKILEAMACGVPVVSTSLGAAGLGMEDGRHLVLAESPADLATLTGSILDQPVLGAALTRAARLRVEQHFAWPAVAEPLVELHREFGSGH